MQDYGHAGKSSPLFKVACYRVTNRVITDEEKNNRNSDSRSSVGNPEVMAKILDRKTEPVFYASDLLSLDGSSARSCLSFARSTVEEATWQQLQLLPDGELFGFTIFVPALPELDGG